MKKKILSIALVVCLLATALVSASLAYFTDDDQNTNEFTVGNVAIDLYETVGHKDGADEDKVPEEVNLNKGDKETKGIKYADITPGDVMKKVVTVENTGSEEAYIALVIKHEGYYNFNQNVDEYYEKLADYGEDAMQGIIDEVFPGWNLLYDKTKVANNEAQVRYTIETLPTGEEGTTADVLGVGYAQENADASGKAQYHYSGKYFTNGVGMKTLADGEPDFFTISSNGAHDRVWIVYLEADANEKFIMDLTTVCPDYFDNNSTKAFNNMVLDVKAFAIQADGFADPADAFAEALAPGFGF